MKKYTLQASRIEYLCGTSPLHEG